MFPGCFRVFQCVSVRFRCFRCFRCLGRAASTPLVLGPSDLRTERGGEGEEGGTPHRLGIAGRERGAVTQQASLVPTWVESPEDPRKRVLQEGVRLDRGGQ